MSELANARAALAAWVDEAGDRGRRFLQAHLRLELEGYAVRHVDDAGRPSGEMRGTENPLDARNIALTRDDGAHRPLKTSPNLQRGWRIDRLDAAGLWSALDFLYPAAALHWYRDRKGTLEVTSWREVAERQSGMYAAVKLLEEEAVARATASCCAAAMCTREVRWGIEPGDEALSDGPAPDSDAVVPCPEACSLFVSFAREVLKVEREARDPAGPLGTLSEAEAEQVRAIVRAAGDGPLPEVREGEFEDPLNRRRIRYLAERLAS